jgi:gliding motility-associated-like protein
MSAGSHTITVRNPSDITCVSSATVVPAIVLPTAPIAASCSVVQTTCFVSTGEITVLSPLGGLEYSIDNGTYSSSTIFSNVNSGSHTITVRSISDLTCVSSSSIVFVNPQPLTPAMPSISANVNYCSADTPVDLVSSTSTIGGVLVWYADAELQDSIGAGSNFTPFMTVGTNSYYVTETSAQGCESEANSTTQIIQFCDIEIPTAFTPDGDGKNDAWVLENIDIVFPENIVRIYNRWGSLIFESVKGEYGKNSWDGKFNGKNLPVDSYYFIVEYNDSKTKTATGTVTILFK